MLEHRLATIDDAVQISHMLRQRDVDEIYASHGMTPLDGVTLSFHNSVRCWVTTLDGVPLAIYGVAPSDHPKYGVPWLLATDELHRHRKALLSQSRFGLQEMHKLFPFLTNFVDERNEDSIKYLKWLGFEFPQRFEQFGYEGRPFWQFIRKQHV